VGVRYGEQPGVAVVEVGGLIELGVALAEA
jgi:hypothetical protein